MDIKSRLSALWILATVNYLYCDLMGLMNPKLLRQFYAGNVILQQHFPKTPRVAASESC
jgi:hypothetical protein